MNFLELHFPSHESLSALAKKFGQAVVYVNNGLDYDVFEDGIFDIIESSFDSIFNEGLAKERFNQFLKGSGGVFFFDTQKEASDFFGVFLHDDILEDTSMNACMYNSAGEFVYAT